MLEILVFMDCFACVKTDDGGTKLFYVEGIFHAVWDFKFFWCEFCMFCLSIFFDSHCKCITGLLSNYSWGTEAWDLFLGLARICSGCLRDWGLVRNYLFGL